MVDHLEDEFVAECRRQGYQPDSRAVEKAAIALAGSSLTNEGNISLLNVGIISVPDFARSIRTGMPEAFSALADDAPAKSAGHVGLTASYIAELSASKRKPIDASKYTGLTRQYLQENQGKHR